MAQRPNANMMLLNQEQLVEGSPILLYHSFLQYINAIERLMEGLKLKKINWDSCSRLLEALELFYIRHEQRLEMERIKGMHPSKQMQRWMQIYSKYILRKLASLRQICSMHSEERFRRIYSIDFIVDQRAPYVPASPWVRRNAKLHSGGYSNIEFET